jgi:valyl-tRNA synthetase
MATDSATIRRLAKVSELIAPSDVEGTAAGHAVLADGSAVAVPLGDLIDLEKECGRLGAELTRLEGQIAAQERKLGNEQFVSKAPAAVVQAERDKLASWRDKAETLRQKRRQLDCAG